MKKKQVTTMLLILSLTVLSLSIPPEKQAQTKDVQHFVSDTQTTERPGVDSVTAIQIKYDTTVSWNNVNDAISYEIYSRKNPKKEFELTAAVEADASDISGTTSWQFDQSAVDEREYVIVAVFPDGKSAPSRSIFLKDHSYIYEEVDEDYDPEDEESVTVFFPIYTDENSFVTRGDNREILIDYVGNDSIIRIPDYVRIIQNTEANVEFHKVIIPGTVEKIESTEEENTVFYNPGCIEFETGDIEIDPYALCDLDTVFIAPKGSKAWKYAFDYGSYATDDPTPRLLLNYVTDFAPYDVYSGLIIGQYDQVLWKATPKKEFYRVVSNRNVFSRKKPGTGYLVGTMDGKTFKMKVVTKKRTMKNVTEYVLKKVIKKGMTQYEKVEAVFDWITSRHMYGRSTTRVSGAERILTTGNGVCSDYSLAFKYFMDKLKIPCRYVPCYVENHAWNMVKIGKYWYQLDLTHDRFLTNSLGNYHYDKSKFPKCKSKKYNKLEEVFVYNNEGYEQRRFCKIDKNGNRTFMK